MSDGSSLAGCGGSSDSGVSTKAAEEEKSAQTTRTKQAIDSSRFNFCVKQASSRNRPTDHTDHDQIMIKMEIRANSVYLVHDIYIYLLLYVCISPGWPCLGLPWQIRDLSHPPCHTVMQHALDSALLCKRAPQEEALEVILKPVD